MDFLLLGPLQVVRDGVDLQLGGPKQRGILGALLLRAGSVVSVDRLVDEIWDEDPPDSVRNAVQVYVTQLRRVLGPADGKGPILTRAPGYVLDLSGHDDDLSRFRRLTGRARGAAAEGDHAVAVAHFSAALRLWRGAPLADVRLSGDAPGILARLDEERLTAVEDRVDALLADGRHAEAVGELEELVSATPLRERLQHQLVMALYRCGRQADALDAVGRARAVLVEELGLDPGPALRDLERAVLRQDPALDLAVQSRPTQPAGNVPRPLTRLLGRDEEVDDLVRQLDRSPLVTLTGPGGSGKTRLSLAVARALMAAGRGVWFVELAPLSDPAAVPQAVALTIGVEEQPGQPVTEAVTGKLRAGKAALVLDNCEHLGAACADVCRELLAHCPELVVLATSREALGMSGEVVWQVEPLAVPDPLQLPASDELWSYAAVELFAERARDAVPTLRFTDDDAPDVARICARLAGLPLAIELAAARVRALSVAQIAARLDAQLGLLTGAQRGRPDRQQTLRQTLDWSHELLSENERRLFAWLSVFPGDFALDAVESLIEADGGSPAEALDLLDALVTKSLVVVRRDRGQVRYRVLEPLRQYAAERLEQRGDADPVRTLHALHYLALAEEAQDALGGGPDQAAWFARLEDERDNLRAAFDQFCRGSDASPAARIACALWRFWLVHGPLSEGRTVLERALSLGALPEELRAKTLLRAGVFAHQLLDHRRAAELYEACTDIVAAGGPSVLLADVLANRGLLAENQGRLTEATALLEEVLRLRRALHDERGLPNALDNLGQLKLRCGELPAARQLAEEGCAAFRATGDLAGLAVALDNLGRIAEREADDAGAAKAYAEVLRLSREIGDRWSVAYGLAGLGRVAAARGDAVEAVELLAAAATARARVGDVLPPDAEAEHAELLSDLGKALDPADFDRAWQRGGKGSAADPAAYGLAYAAKAVPMSSESTA